MQTAIRDMKTMHQPSDASTVQAPIDASPVHQINAPLHRCIDAPCTLLALAMHQDINYPSLRNRWIGLIELAHAGLRCPVIRENKKLTEFGIKAALDFIDHVVRGRLTADQWTASVRQAHQFDIPPTPTQVEVQPYALSTHVEEQKAIGLVQLNLTRVIVRLGSADTSQLDQEIAEAQNIKAQVAQGLQAAIAAQFLSNLEKIVAEGNHLAEVIGANAVVEAAQALATGKLG